MKYSYANPDSFGSSPIVNFLMGCFFFCFGVFFWCHVSLWPMFSAYNSSDWQTVPCTIVKSEIEKWRGATHTAIQFDYMINGKKHRSSTYDFTVLNRSRNRCEEIVEANPVGKQTDCFYDVDEHERAVIVREFDFSVIGGFLFPLIFIVLGLSMTLPTTLSTIRKISLGGSY